MSSPTPGSDPDHPQGGASDGRQSWRSPGSQGYGGATGGRPPQVLTAAMLGFVVALFALLAALGLFALATLLGILAVFGAIYLALAVVNVWGGIVAIMGKGSVVLKGAGIATAVLALIGLVLALTQGSFSFLSLLLVIAGVAIFVLLGQPASQQFFAIHGKK
jgi:hypothetical protein